MLVLLNGALAPSAPPARVVDGRVLAPPALVARIADRVTIAGHVMQARRGDRTCSAQTRGIDELVVLAPLARCLGVRVAWHSRGKALSLDLPAPAAARTHAPFDPNAPRVAPTAIFTPEPAPPTPRVIATGVPRPRRTAIPVTPSFPLTTPRP